MHSQESHKSTKLKAMVYRQRAHRRGEGREGGRNRGRKKIDEVK